MKLNQDCRITYLGLHAQTHNPLILFASCNLDISRTSRGLPVSKPVLMPLKGQQLTQPDVTLKHWLYTEVMAARSLSGEESASRSRGRGSQTMSTQLLWWNIFTKWKLQLLDSRRNCNNKRRAHKRVAIDQNSACVFHSSNTESQWKESMSISGSCSYIVMKLDNTK